MLYLPAELGLRRWPKTTRNAGIRPLVAMLALGLSGCAKTPAPELPIAVSVTPSSGGGARFDFVAVYSDSKGAANIRSAGVLINDELSGVSSCYVMYGRVKGTIGLVEDEGVGLLPLSAGGDGKVVNSQCTLYAKGSSATDSGNELTLRGSVEFNREFGGSKNIYLYARNMQGGETPMVPATGVWLIP